MTEALPELTDRQRQVYEFIEARIEEWGYPPTIREIGEHLGIKSTNGVADHLKALKRKGYLQQRDQKSRTLAPTSEASKKRGPRPSPHAKKSGSPLRRSGSWCLATAKASRSQSWVASLPVSLSWRKKTPKPPW